MKERVGELSPVLGVLRQKRPCSPFRGWIVPAKGYESLVEWVLILKNVGCEQGASWGLSEEGSVRHFRFSMKKD
jgi:hypothetical protein